MNNFTKRLIFGTIYVVLIIIATQYTPAVFFFIFSIFMFFCIYEFQQMQKVKGIISYVLALTSVFLIYELDHFLNPIIPLKYVFSFIIFLFFLPFITTLFSNEKNSMQQLNTHFSLFFYIIIPFLLLLSIPYFSEAKFDAKLVLGIFILTWINDTFAYLIGKQFGKRKLFERISPKKTIEGFIGGFIFTIIGGFIVSKFFQNIELMHWISIAIIVSVFGTLGDLIESKFKRQANIKDSSNSIPGHGGFLDRLDSVIFATPFVFIYLILIN